MYFNTMAHNSQYKLTEFILLTNKASRALLFRGPLLSVRCSVTVCASGCEPLNPHWLRKLWNLPLPYFTMTRPGTEKHRVGSIIWNTKVEQNSKMFACARPV